MSSVCELTISDEIEHPKKSLKDFFFFWIYQPIKTFPMKLARYIIKRTFRKDPALRFAYQSNIAMILYDDQIKWKEGYFSEPPCDLTTHEGRNKMADRLISTLFE
jgi:hypothetical protein